ncbi:hypothetical protein A3F07_02410 [candidate division WWE3 bacterium RIFCSPHIGHO2_12_FULL_38_15]|nr:MAG: hypothetical protein A2793_02615 [candidate division WWE3 bacterium RIFCSPHIGHO2_01_FULL_38_45]OGC48765.1 MAG: hypothetical protein A3F07_02410 [candidate division WWE3 bacterium RIFCSPHIGHO2_12_FULL_38_15]OGC52634.1 MAG: hypothetical protein A3B64_03865 [candidate division WWE3 bacterium RIFCSPLOWO2_01_FULL_37_24]
MKRHTFLIIAVLLLTALIAVTSSAQSAGWEDKIAPDLMATMSTMESQSVAGEVTFMIDFGSEMWPQAELDRAKGVRNWDERGEYVYQTLASARVVREKVIASAGLQANCFLASNICQVSGGSMQIQAAAELSEVAYLRLPAVVQLDPIEYIAAAGADSENVDDVQWNLAAVRADEVWPLGVIGTVVVVMNNDTGVDITHSALAAKYRGNSTGSNDYNWIDPSDVCGGTICDNDGHGTHTMGTIVGDNIGMAPGAKFIAGKGCEYSSCSEYALHSVADWAVAPTRMDGSSPRPDLRPHVINNSWGGPGGSSWYQADVDAWIASGMIPVFSAGNNGAWGCETMGSPGDYANILAWAAVDSNNAVAYFSSRGPRPNGSTGPDMSAPGVGVRSSVPGGGYAEASGTSMAAPHGAGAVALLLSARPDLVGNFDTVRSLILSSAFPLTTTEWCGGVPGDNVPNNTFGWGRLDAYEMIELAGGVNYGTLQGTVVDVTGKRLEGAEVTASSSFTTTSITDQYGMYWMRLGQGTYTVHVNSWGYQSASVVVDVSEDETTELNFWLLDEELYEMNGIVSTRQNGVWVPEPGAEIYLESGGPVGANGLVAVTDQNGQFTAFLPAGTFMLRAQTPLCAGSRSETITVAVPTADPVSFQLENGTGPYGWSDATFSWVDVRSLGRLLTDLANCDDCVEQVTLQTPMSLWDTELFTLTVSSNGWLAAFPSPDLVFRYRPIPLGTEDTSGMFAGHWLDIEPYGSGPNSGVWFVETAEYVAFEWAAFQFPSDRSGVWENFEVIVYRDGTVKYQYRSTSGEYYWSGSALYALVGMQGLNLDASVWGVNDAPDSDHALLWTPTTSGCHVSDRSYLVIVAKNASFEPVPTEPTPPGDNTPTPFPSATASASPTAPSFGTRTYTPTPSNTPTMTATSTQTYTPTPPNTPTVTPEPTKTRHPTHTPRATRVP